MTKEEIKEEVADLDKEFARSLQEITQNLSDLAVLWKRREEWIESGKN